MALLALSPRSSREAGIWLKPAFETERRRMKLAVIGSGMMGSVVAWDLARSRDVDELHVADKSQASLDMLKKRQLGDKVHLARIDVTDEERVRRFLKGSDAAVSALPHGAVHPVDVAAVSSGSRLVNIAFEDEQMRLDRLARSHGSVLIPGCGVAPGLSNILVAEGTRGLGSAEGHIYVGGLPQNPEPPLWYRLVFSVRGLIREYVSARVLRDGKVIDVPPFSEVTSVRFRRPIGELEAFFTDGLGSSVHSLKHLRALDERTLRYPGHAERIKFLLDTGYFGQGPVPIEGGPSVAPISLSESLLREVLTRGDPRDLTVMRVKTSGRRGGDRVQTDFELVDRYDEENKVSSMGRTTGFTAAVVARMLARGEIEGTGVLPPESALDSAAVGRLLRELRSKGVVVRRRQTRRRQSTRAS